MVPRTKEIKAEEVRSPARAQPRLYEEWQRWGEDSSVELPTSCAGSPRGAAFLSQLCYGGGGGGAFPVTVMAAAFKSSMLLQMSLPPTAPVSNSRASSYKNSSHTLLLVASLVH